MSDASIGTKPITLITATPGGGKTALVVSLLQEAIKAGRPVFQQGIPELKLDHSTVPPIAEWTEQREDPETGMMLPYFTFPPKSLVVLDEAQRIFRVRPTGSKVPDHVAAFETVRHTGVTFILITQSPSFLDTHIRKLVGQHIHLRDVGLLGRWYYEWPECESDPAASFNAAPIKKRFKLPKEVFGLYKSSSLHIKRKYSVPPVMMLVAACAVALVVGLWYLKNSVTAKMTPTETAAKGPDKASQVKPVTVVPAQLSGAEYLASFVPTAPGHPESAPIYAPLRVVKDMPRIAGCFASASRCVCITQQGTDAGLDEGQCRAWLEKPRFDPYREPEAVAGPGVAVPMPVAAPTVAAPSKAQPQVLPKDQLTASTQPAAQSVM